MGVGKMNCFDRFNDSISGVHGPVINAPHFFIFVLDIISSKSCFASEIYGHFND